MGRKYSKYYNKKTILINGCYNCIEQKKNHFMSEKPILSIETYKELDTSNRYFEHLSRCSEKKYDEKEEKQMHHMGLFLNMFSIKAPQLLKI